MGKSNKDMIRLAAEAGAKAAIAQWEKERGKIQAERVDRRLYNTKLLLKNYRLFRKHAENAVYEAEQLEGSIFDIMDMMEQSTSNLFVDSVKNSVARTTTLVRHIETMLGLYRVYCEQSGKPEDLRRWRAIQMRYIDEPTKSNLEIAECEHVSDRTIDRDIAAAHEQLAALFFGIDGVKRQ